MSRIAVNICDLSDALRGNTNFLFPEFALKDSPTVRADKSLVDTYAIVLDGPAAQDSGRVEALVSVLQTIIGPRKIGRRVRCYREGPRGGWQEIRPSKEKK